MKIRQSTLPFQLLTTVAGAFIGLGFLAIGLTVWSLRSDAIQASTNGSEAVAILIADQIAQAVAPATEVLDDIRERVAAAGTERPDQFQLRFGDAGEFRYLREQLSRLPPAVVITITNHDGRLINFTPEWPPPPADFSDREYWSHFRADHGSNDLFVSVAVVGRVTGKATVYFSKPIRSRAGDLLGVATVGYGLAYFESIYRSIASLSRRDFLLVRRDGTVLAKFPEQAAPARAVVPASSEWYGIVRDGGGSFRSSRPEGGEPRWVSVQPLKDVPLVVNIGLPESAALQIWNRRASWIGLGVALAAVCAIVLLCAAMAQFRRLIRSEASLAAASNQLESVNDRLDVALNNMLQGLCMFDKDERLVVCNDRYLHMYGLSREDVGPATTLGDLLDRRLARGTFTGDPLEYRARLRAQVAEGRRSHTQIQLPDGRIVALLNQPVVGGGWVATHEDVTERQLAAQQIAYMARHDALTDLSNRLLFRECMEDACTELVASGRAFALFLFDLDLFKAVNDSLGHPVGDLLLKTVAQRLRDCVPPDCAVGRLGGDEFSVLQPLHDGDRASVTELAMRLRKCICAPYEIDGNRIGIGISIGIAVAPEHGDDPSILLKNADLALYRAKAAGRCCYRFFGSEIDAEARMRHTLEIELHDALARAEFHLHYQLIVDSASLQPCGVEVLVRWTHPTLGEISPERFIPIAEESGQITQLGEWILRRACADAVNFPPHIKIAVNLSPVQFRSIGLVESVRDILATSGLSPHRLELEITESVLLHKHLGNIDVLHELSQLGIDIVLDDFGVGYSSFGYLRMFPFAKIKIDKAFVGEMAQRTDCGIIVCAISNLAQALDMKTTAEGVETWDQFSLIRAAGCSQAQGYLFGRPVPAEQLDFAPRFEREQVAG